MLAHNAKITVFTKPEEDHEKIMQGLKALLPFDLEKEKVKIGTVNAESFEDRIVRINEVYLDKQKNVTHFLEWLVSQLSEPQRQMLLRQKDTRLDDELFFFIRIDKEEWLTNKRIHITDSGNCYHIKFHVAAFPKNKERALKVIEEMLK